jgi:hypothetical protein
MRTTPDYELKKYELSLVHGVSIRIFGKKLVFCFEWTEKHFFVDPRFQNPSRGIYKEMDQEVYGTYTLSELCKLPENKDKNSLNDAICESILIRASMDIQTEMQEKSCEFELKNQYYSPYELFEEELQIFQITNFNSPIASVVYLYIRHVYFLRFWLNFVGKVYEGKTQILQAHTRDIVGVFLE